MAGRVPIPEYGGASQGRAEFLDQLELFGALFGCEYRQSGDVAAWARQACNIAGAQRIADCCHHDGKGAGRLADGLDGLRRMRDDDIIICLNQLGCQRGQSLGIAISVPPLECNGFPVQPTELFQRLHKGREALLRLQIAPCDRHQHAHAPYPLRLLRTGRERPTRRAAEQRDELAPVHSITSSAVACSVRGTVRPSACAVLRLITNSNCVGCRTGISAGFEPFRICPMYSPAWRYIQLMLGP